MNISYIYIYIHTYLHVYIHIYIYVYIYISIYTYIHTYIYIYGFRSLSQGSWTHKGFEFSPSPESRARFGSMKDWLHTNTYTYIYIYLQYIQLYKYIYIYVINIYTICKCICTHTHMCLDVYLSRNCESGDSLICIRLPLYSRDTIL